MASVRHAFVSAIPDEPESGRVRPSDWNAEHVVDIDAADVPYDNTTSGLAAGDVQAALDEVVASGGGPHTHDAEDVTYDGTSSGLAAANAQAAIDELKGLVDAGSNTAASGNYLISGGGVAWVGGLDFTVSAADYVIQGTQYASAQDDITLSAADPTDPRIDVIAVNTSGAVAVITGTPAANPERPDVDPATYLELSFVYVPATATDASVSVEQVYRENVEWTTSTSGGTFNAASTNNPFAGSKTVEGTNVANGHYVQFEDGAPFDPAEFDSLVFHIRSKGTWPNQKSVTLTLRNAGTQRGTAVVLKHGLFSFDSSNTTDYQQIVIPADDFAANGLTCNQLRMAVAGGGAAIGMYIDNVEWQTGVVAPSSSDRVRWRGDYSAATAYSKNDAVLYNGVQYVALAPGAGFAPDTNPAYWQASTAPRGVPTVNVTTDLTLSGVHNGCKLVHTSGAGAGDVLTIPANGDDPLGTDFTVNCINLDADDWVIEIDTDTLIRRGAGSVADITLAQYEAVWLSKTASTEWFAG